MLTRLGRFTVRRHRLVLSLTVLFMIAAAVVGTRAFGVLQDEGFADPSSESAHAADVLDDELSHRPSGGDCNGRRGAGAVTTASR